MRNRVRGEHEIHIDRKIVYRIESDFDIDVKFESRPETLELLRCPKQMCIVSIFHSFIRI